MKKNIIWTIYLLVIVFAASNAFAEVIVNHANYAARYDDNSVFITSTSPVTDVKSLGIICANSDCSQINGFFFFGDSSSSNVLPVTYPTEPSYSSDYGYGVYFYKDGYIPYEVRDTAYGTGTDPTTYNVYQTKMDTCRIVIDEYEVVNEAYPNQPVMIDINTRLDATVHSPIIHSGPIAYVPAALRSYYQVAGQVELQITDQAGAVVNTQSQNVNIDFSGSQRVHFQYTPNTIGRFTARVTALATDNKCASSQSHISQKNFNIITQNPTNMCYTLLNNLSVKPEYPQVGENVEISVNKITNYYNSAGALFVLPTRISFSDQYHGAEVASSSDTFEANANTNDNQQIIYDYAFSQPGYHSISLTGSAINCPYNNQTMDTVTQSIYVQIKNNVTINGSNVTTPVNQPPVMSKLPDQVFTKNSGVHTSVFAIKDYTFDPDNNSLLYFTDSQSRSDIVTCAAIFTTGAVSCRVIPDQTGCSLITVRASDAESFTRGTYQVCVVEPNHAPIIGPLQSITILENSGKNENVANIGAVTSDPDGDTISYSIPTQTRQDIVTCEIDSMNMLDCTAVSGTGVSQITIVASDGSLTDSKTISVNVIPQTNTNRAPVVGPFPDQVFAANSGFHTLFPFSTYINDPDGDLLSASMTETASLIVTCSFDSTTRAIGCNVRPGMSGVSYVTIAASDGRLSANATFKITVTPPVNTNRAPVIIPFPDATFTANSGRHTMYPLVNYISDPDGDTLSVGISQTASGVANCFIDGATRTIICDVQPGVAFGQNDVTITASDGHLSVQDTFRVTVYTPSVTNNPPSVLITDIDLYSNSGLNTNVLNLNNYASDPEGQTLSFTIEAESNTGLVDCSLAGSMLSCQVASGMIGFSDIRVLVSDGPNNVRDTFRVNVINRPQNLPPTANFPTVQLTKNSGVNNNILTLTNYASDPEGAALTFLIVNQTMPALVTCQITGVTLGCTVSSNMLGTSTVSIQVSDGTNVIVRSFNVNVVEGNRPPVLAVPPQTIKKNAGTSPLVNLQSYASDADNDNLTFRFVSNSNPSVVTCTLAGSIISCTPVTDKIGVTTLTIEVSDGKVAIQSSFTVTVTDTLPPLVSSRGKLQGDLVISQFEVIEDRNDHQIPVLISITNDKGHREKGVRLSLTAPDLALRDAAGPFDISAGQTVSKTLYLPLEGRVAAGLYPVRLSITTEDGTNRIEYRELLIR